MFNENPARPMNFPLPHPARRTFSHTSMFNNVQSGDKMVDTVFVFKVKSVKKEKNIRSM